MKKLLFALFILILTGCSTALPVSKTATGKYRVNYVKKVDGVSMVKIDGYNETFVLHSDTLKVDDIITITWLKLIR